jgi:hypothetical protein
MRNFTGIVMAVFVSGCQTLPGSDTKQPEANAIPGEAAVAAYVCQADHELYFGRSLETVESVNAGIQVLGVGPDASYRRTTKEIHMAVGDNTIAMLKKIDQLCIKHHLGEISDEDYARALFETETSLITYKTVIQNSDSEKVLEVAAKHGLTELPANLASLEIALNRAVAATSAPGQTGASESTDRAKFNSQLLFGDLYIRLAKALNGMEQFRASVEAKISQESIARERQNQDLRSLIGASIERLDGVSDAVSDAQRSIRLMSERGERIDTEIASLEGQMSTIEGAIRTTTDDLKESLAETDSHLQVVCEMARPWYQGAGEFLGTLPAQCLSARGE